MLKDTSYQEKISILEFWLPEIVEVIKKDLKNEHLKIDKTFCKRYFLGKNISQVPLEELALAYKKDILDGNVGLAEFIATRWLLKNTDVYGFFEERLKEVTHDFEALSELPQELSATLVEESVRRFGAKRSYLFSVFNSVVFPPSIYDSLKKMALQETHIQTETKEREDTQNALETMQKRHLREVNMLQDRFEKKLSGMQKKYLHDVEKLKKQVSQLQSKLK